MEEIATVIIGVILFVIGIAILIPAPETTGTEIKPQQSEAPAGPVWHEGIGYAEHLSNNGMEDHRYKT